MDAIEKRARELNPNVAVIHQAMQHFPEGSWMRGALDHAAAELAVLHGRCQRAALTPPEGYVLVPEVMTEDMAVAFAEAWFSKVRAIDDCEPQDAWAAALALRPEVQ